MLGKNLEISQNILMALNELMALHVPSEDEYAGKPFVTCDRKRGLRFGVTTGKLRGGLYAIYHLLDSLEAASFFRGQREPSMDLDDTADCVHLRSFKIYDGVVLSVTQGRMKLTIETGETAETVLDAIQRGINDARKERDWKLQKETEYRKHIESQWNKEENTPFILDSVKNDEIFIKEYLQQVIANYLGPHTGVSLRRRYSLTESEMSWPQYMRDDYPIKGRDMRPIFEVSVADCRKNWVLFHDSGLGKKLSEIFVGVGGFFLPQGQRGSEDIEFSVRGNPLRLVGDIFDRDPELARYIANREKFGLIDRTPS